MNAIISIILFTQVGNIDIQTPRKKDQEGHKEIWGGRERERERERERVKEQNAHPIIGETIKHYYNKI